MTDINQNKNSVLKKILDCSKSGRALTEDSVKKAVEEFLKKPFFESIPGNVEPDLVRDYEAEFNNFMGTKAASRSYGEFVEFFYETRSKDVLKSVPELGYLSLTGSFPNKGEDFYGLSVEDYLELAGEEELLEKWFAFDIGRYKEQNNGRTPNIRTVLQACSNVLNVTNLEIVVCTPRMGGLFPVRGADTDAPFSRSDKKANLVGNEEVKAFMEEFMAANWTWILMVEVPYKLLKSGKINVFSD